MMEGQLHRMMVSLADTVCYKLKMSELVTMNNYLNRKIKFSFSGIITCVSCGKRTKTSFNQGFCYDCFRSAPESAECIIRPELCRAHLGEGRDLEWEERNHNQRHFVYLASTDTVKVGVTRTTQVPTRWIDQGAHQAIILAETPNRYQAGVLEVALKSYFTDKTNWRKMLRNELDTSIDLVEEKWKLDELLPSDLTQFFADNDEVTTINYPVLQFPDKIKTVSFDKEPTIEGMLLGIKGQYLLLDGDRVLNIRKHTGYHVTFEGE
jgi:hypothetical protein